MVGGIVGVSALVDACTVSQTSTSSGTHGGQRRGGDLTFATEAEIASFDPRIGAWDNTAYLYARTVYDPLFTQAADGSIKPYLARSITPNPDYTQWTIALRPGVTFHDGSPFDAGTVKVNLDGVTRSPLTGPFLFNVQSTRVIDPLTLLVTMYTPWVPFPSYLTNVLGYMCGLKQLADTSGRARPVGTGPFVFKEWVPGDHFTAVRNPAYWRPHLPYLDSITFKSVTDPISRGNGLAAGDFDLMHSADTQNVADFLRRPGFAQVNDRNAVLGEPDQNFIMLNTAVPPLNDLRVRQALACATDKRRVIDTLYNALTRPTDGPFPSGSPYYGPTGYPSHDPTRARALVAEYEKDVGPVSFRFTTVNTQKGRLRNELLQAMWKDVGINTDIIVREQSALLIDVIVGNYQACGFRQFNAVDPDANYPWWSSSTTAPIGKQALNFTRIRDPQLDAGLVAGRTQVDPQVRAAAYRLVAERLGALVPYVWIGPTVWIVAAHATVGGLGQATLPDGAEARAMLSGVIWPAGLWRAS
ncbi:MAG TPA: ABC transporter substrate-binding protein [Methylomirabilota bacterium]|nr:ABC transporter substrate-binding protein [Methylomirabilota bacterium]